MQRTIEYYYNLFPEKIYEENDFYYFYIDNIKYFFVPYLRPEKDLPNIYYLSKELFSRKFFCHELIINKENRLLTNINEQNYILLKVNEIESDNITLNDMLIYSSNLILKETNSDLYLNNWGELWSQKIDYFEYQIRELGKDKELILNSFTYYIGLAENAISYANEANLEDQMSARDIITLCHRRIFYPNLKLNYFNPLSFIFDLEVRDVAEYIKAMFFKGKDVWKEIENYFSKKILTSYSIKMLYARLLYPSYYFDIYEEVMNNSKDENELMNVILKREEYEEFLIEMYYFLSKKANLYKIDWLIKS